MEVAFKLSKPIGYPFDTKIYIVSSKIYGKDDIQSLKHKFPKLCTKLNLSLVFVLFLNQLQAFDFLF